MKNKQASIMFIFVTVMLDMIGVGLIIPSLPDVMRRFVSGSDVSSYYGYFISVYAVMQFLAAPLLGAVSDLYGRRPVLLLSLLVAGLDYILMAFAPTLLILFAGRVIAGLTGANFTVAMAYIADVSKEEDRSANFGLVGAAFGLGFIIGPALGGILGEWGPQYPFLAAAVMNLLNFFFGLLILPESLTVDKRQAFSWGKINPLVSLTKIFKASHILAFVFVHFLFQLAGQTHPSIWTLYTQTRFSWSASQVGWSLAVVGILSAIAQGGLTRVLIPRLGERRSVLLCAFGGAIAFLLFGLATEGWMMYAILVLSAAAWIGGPALQSMITGQVSAQDQGELQGSLVSLTSLAAIMNPLIVTQLFAAFTEGDHGVFLPGAPYFFAAAVSLLAGFVVLMKRNAGEAGPST